MALTFPTAPADGATYVLGGITFTYTAASDSWLGAVSGSGGLTLPSGTVNGQTIHWNGTAWLPETDVARNFITAGTAAPTVRTDGLALVEGDIYYNTTSDLLYAYNGTIWNAIGGSKWTDVGTGNIYRNSKVAIGSTTDPTTALYVTGDTTMTANLVVDTTSLVVDSVNNRVGFGTATPVARVDVVAGSAAHSVVAVAAAAMDLSLGQVFTKTVTSTNTWSFASIPAGRSVTAVLHITNGGGFTQTWPTGTKWAGGVPPVLTTAGTDVLVFTTHDGGTTWRANIFGTDHK